MPILTIGMASYANRAEVWFTVQALRLYHQRPEIEILVVDNFGDDKLGTFLAGAGVRYVAYTEVSGAANAKQRVFEVASGEWVLLLDSHILLPPGAVDRLLEWIEAHRHSQDLIQGPLLYDDLQTTADAMNPVWSGGMWGQWRTQNVGPGADPYPIQMHGCGLMASRKDSWLGFNPAFKGFGGEEGYIHEKYRKAGRQVLCLPFLRWVHHFKLDEAPYPLVYQDRVRNYVIGFQELGLDMQPLVEHFGQAAIDQAKEEIRAMNPIKIGVIAPTYNRPDFARFLALQMENQVVHPHLLAFHQNGTAESYEWAVADINRHYAYLWTHTPEQIPQEEWYAVPLQLLIEEGCTHFFWCDHDDIYGLHHIATGMQLLEQGYDHVVNQRSGMLLLNKPFNYDPDQVFQAHDPGGMSSSMCFNLEFAKELLKDLRENATKPNVVGCEDFTLNDTDRLYYADQVVRRITMPKFRCLMNTGIPSTTYVCHQGTVSSSHWLTP
jgi:hypothetical protein